MEVYGLGMSYRYSHFSPLFFRRCFWKQRSWVHLRWSWALRVSSSRNIPTFFQGWGYTFCWSVCHFHKTWVFLMELTALNIQFLGIPLPPTLIKTILQFFLELFTAKAHGNAIFPRFFVHFYPVYSMFDLIFYFISLTYLKCGLYIVH